MGNLRSIIILDKIKTCYINTSTYTSYFLSSMVDYWYDRHNKWVFIPNYTCPIPLQHIKNDIHSDWVYHSSMNTLKSTDKNAKAIYKVNWLSAQISITTLTTSNEFNIDDFLSDFMVCGGVDLSDNHNMTSVPRISYLFISWCIYTKQWFPSDAEVVFHIIDSNGFERELQVLEHNYIDIAPRHF